MEDKASSESERHLRGGAPTGDDSSEVKEKSKNWLKIIILFLVSIFLLFGVFYAGYWLGKSEKLKTQSEKPQLKAQNLTPPLKQPNPTPTPDPTADWKTYKNENFGYIIKYPIAWGTKPSIKQGEKNEPMGLHGANLIGRIETLYKDYPDQYGPPLLQIEAIPNQTLTDFENKKIHVCTDSQIDTIVNDAPAAVGHRISLDVEGQHYSVGHYYCALVFNQKSAFTYELVWHEGSFKDSGLFNQILSTFQFLD